MIIPVLTVLEVKTTPKKKKEEVLTIEEEGKAEEPVKETKVSDNPKIDLDEFMNAMNENGTRTEEGEEVKVPVTPRRIREALNRPIGSKYHQKLMKAAETLAEQGLITVENFEGKRTKYFKLK